MINSISLNTISKAQFKNQAPIYIGQQENKLIPEKKECQINISDLANAIKKVNNEDAPQKLPNAEAIIEKFFNGELDVRNLKKDNVITLNLNGQNYNIKIKKDGEFTCQIEGTNDNIRIYVSNKFGEDCVCLEYNRKIKDSEQYDKYRTSIPFEEYDKIIEKHKKIH